MNKYILIFLLTLANISNATVSNLLRLKIEGEFGADETVIYFDPDATDGFDGNFDALKMYSGTPGLPNISSRSGNADFAINVLGGFNHQRDVPLTVYITRTGSYSINVLEVLNFDPTALIYMEDITTGISYNLLTEQEIQFNFNPGFYNNRFILHFYPPLLFLAWNETCNLGDGKIKIINPNTLSWKVSLFSSQGQQLSQIDTFTQGYSFENLSFGDFNIKLKSDSTYNIVVSKNIQPGSVLNTEFNILNNQTQFSVLYPDPQNTYVWNFGDGSDPVNGFDVIHIFDQLGVFVINLTVSNEYCSRTVSREIIVSNTITDIEKYHTSLYFNINPNSVNETISIKISFITPITVKRIEIQDMLGKTISSEFININKDVDISIPASNLNNGLYQIIIHTNNDKYTKFFRILK
jgi:PKD repeat protein